MDKDKVVMSHMSPDGDEGYPGAVIATTTFQLTSDNRLFITMEAVSTKPTPINLTNHSYFNLAGHVSVNVWMENVKPKGSRPP